MELCVAIVFSGVAFVVGALWASIANPSGSYGGFYVAGGALVVAPAAAMLSLALLRPAAKSAGWQSVTVSVGRLAQGALRGLRSTGRVLQGPFALAAGVYLAGLPTYYAIFTVGHTSSAAIADRHLGRWLFLAWILVAGGVGYRTLWGDREVLRLLRLLRASSRAQITRRARTSARRAIQLLLAGDATARGEALRALAPKIYEVDDAAHPNELAPFLEDNPPAKDRWKKSEGVLWLAFNANDPTAPIFVAGQNLVRATNAIGNEEQRETFAHLTLVASIVIQDASSLPIGVLGCSSKDATALSETESEAMVTLASELGILLPLAG
jgi:hypothetical protein